MTEFKKICVLCGKEFTTTANRRKVCYDDHYYNCEVCGKPFLIHSENHKKTCSEECRRKSISNTENTKFQNQSFKHICKICGKEFYNNHKKDEICDDIHYLTCEYCGKPFPATKEQILRGKKTCSDECRYKLTSQKFLQNIDSSLMKQRETNIRKYGVSSYSKTDEFKDKVRNTSLAKYGEISYTKTEEYKHKTKATNLARRGYEWSLQDPSVREKSKQTWLKKYGYDNPSKSPDVYSQWITSVDKLPIYLQFKDNPKQFILDNFKDHKPSLKELSEYCGIHVNSVGDVIHKSHCEDCIAYVFSYMEQEVYDFLREFLPGDIEIERNTFQIITPYELDIYIPQYKFAIECNPTYTHNSSYGVNYGGSEEPLKSFAKPINYHRMKSEMCKEKGIFLFHIFGYEWTHRKEIIRSMIRNDLHFTENKIYARKTTLAKIPSSTAYKFLQENHRQGGIQSKVALGLYYQNELVSVMTFGGMRNTIGQVKKSEENENCWELSRFCNKINTSIVGGASKLFKHFIEEYHPREVKSFSDISHATGNLYPTLGFEFVHENNLGYVWVNLKTDDAISRNSAQKRFLKTLLHDEDIDLSKTEAQIMVEHGFVQVFNSGTILWKWKSL